MSKEARKAASAFGRLGGQANSPAQLAQRAGNLAKITPDQRKKAWETRRAKNNLSSQTPENK